MNSLEKRALRSTVDSDELKIKDLIHSFSDVDIKNHFSFTSGHLGALPVNDDVLVEIAVYKRLFKSLKYITLFFKELIKLFILFILPVKNMAIVFRTVLRCFCNPKPMVSHSLTVVSLGNQSSGKDAYFGPLLTQLDNKFDYLKIVGGYGFRNKNYFYLESALSFFDLVKFSIYILFSPLLSLGYLLSKVVKLDRLDCKEVFFLLGLKEINSGVITQNNLIATSINAWLKNSKTNKILYPMEGRSWEKSIVKCINERSVQSVGYIHCMLTPRHLSLVMHGFYSPKEIPSIIVAPSQMIARLVRVTFPNAIVRKGYFLRGNKKESLSKKSADALLFALTGNVEESKRIMDCIAKSDIQKSHLVVIRLNPNTSSYLHLKSYAETLELDLYSADQQFSPSVCFFRSSSVALDYLKLNITPVYLTLNEVISGNVFDLDDKLESMTLNVSSSFKVNLDSILSKIKLSPQLDCGEKISDYYLDQSYNPTDLIPLIN